MSEVRLLPRSIHQKIERIVAVRVSETEKESQSVRRTPPAVTLSPGLGRRRYIARLLAMEAECSQGGRAGNPRCLMGR